MRRLFATLAMAAAAALAASGAARAADVALFTNTTYVDYTPTDQFSEASNVEDSLEAWSHEVQTFTGITQADFQSALNGREVLVIPELERGDLFAALSAPTRTEIVEFVNGGGGLVTFNFLGNNNLNLLNGLFGYSLVDEACCFVASTLNAAGAAGTQFAGGDSSLPGLDATDSVTSGSLPAGSRVVYNSGTSVTVAVIPQGAGYVILLGWDWFDAVPLGTQGAVESGWHRVLNAAVNQALDPTKADVALLSNTSYVDYGFGNIGNEASNMQAAIQHQGNKVMPFTGISASALSSVLANRDALVVPEPRKGDLFGDLSVDARAQIVEFVEGGGTMIVGGDGTRDIALINGLFGFSLVHVGSLSSYPLDAAEAAGTPFAGGPATIPDLSDTFPVSQGSLPPGSRAIYHDGDDVAAATIPVGCGTVTFLGWDWFDAVPVGSADGGWNGVLNRALGQERRMLVDKDFNGDGQTDTLWRNTANGNTAIWLMQDTAKLAGGQLGAIPLFWQIAGTGDFNRDCKSDIVWRNTRSGDTVVWPMDGLTRASGVNIGAPPTVWEIEEVYDTNGDGFADIFWRNATSGALAVWVMDGYVRGATGFPGSVPAVWQVE